MYIYNTNNNMIYIKRGNFMERSELKFRAKEQLKVIGE